MRSVKKRQLYSGRGNSIIDTVLDNINAIKQEREQQGNIAKEHKGVPGNAEGVEGDMRVVKEGISTKLFVKGTGEWKNVDLASSTVQTGLVTGNPDTSVGGGAPSESPVVTLELELSGNTHVFLEWTVAFAGGGFTLKRNSVNNFEPALTEVGSTDHFLAVCLANSGTSFTDTGATANAINYYQLRAVNTAGTATVQAESITTNPLYTGHNFKILDPQTGSNTAYSDGELVYAAEFEEPAGFTGAVNVLGKYINDNTFINGSIAYNDANGDAVFDGEGYNTSTTGNNFFAQDDIDKIFQIAANGVLSNSRSCTPDTLSVTASTISTNRIDLSITGNTVVTRNIEIFRSTDGSTWGSAIATITPSASGYIANTSVTTPYENTGLSAGTTYYYRVRAKNDEFTGDYSNVDSSNTNTASTAWSNVPADFSMATFGNAPLSSSDWSAGKTITLTNGNGNTVITCQQPSAGSLMVAVSTTSEPSTTASYGTVKYVSNAGTYYLKFKYTDLKGANLSAESRTITFENNNISNTDLQITVSTA